MDKILGVVVVLLTLLLTAQTFAAQLPPQWIKCNDIVDRLAGPMRCPFVAIPPVAEVNDWHGLEHCLTVNQALMYCNTSIKKWRMPQ